MAGMFGFWSRHKANLTAARAGRGELLRQRDIAIGERNELMRQRDIALGEANEFRRQRDLLRMQNEQLKRGEAETNEREDRR